MTAKRVRLLRFGGKVRPWRARPEAWLRNGALVLDMRDATHVIDVSFVGREWVQTFESESI